MENVIIAKELVGHKASRDESAFRIRITLGCSLADGKICVSEVKTDSDDVICGPDSCSDYYAGSPGYAEQFKSGILKALQDKCGGTVKLTHDKPDGELEFSVDIYGEYCREEAPSMYSPGHDAGFIAHGAKAECDGIFFKDDEDDLKYAEAERLMDACDFEKALGDAVGESDATYDVENIDKDNWFRWWS